jgi:hypothetical protein
MDRTSQLSNLLSIAHGAILFIAIALFQILVLGPAMAEGDPIQAAPGQAVGLDLSLAAAESSLEIKYLGSIDSWALQPQESPNTCQGTLAVKAVGPWIISVLPDPTTTGYMSEYDPASSKFVQGGRRLSEPLVIAAQDGNAVDLSKGGVLIQGQGNMVVPITFEQKVSWSDPPLTDGHSYQIGLTFTGLA